jgi:hypothetical protein
MWGKVSKIRGFLSILLQNKGKSEAFRRKKAANLRVGGFLKS